MQVTNTVNVRKNVDLAPDAKRIVALLPAEGGGNATAEPHRLSGKFLR
jgi:hypothetical protein